MLARLHFTGWGATAQEGFSVVMVRQMRAALAALATDCWCLRQAGCGGGVRALTWEVGQRWGTQPADPDHCTNGQQRW